MTVGPKQADDRKSRGKLSRWRIYASRSLRLCGALLLIYVAILLIGLFPVNSGFQNARDGIEIWVISSDIHADIVVPIATDVVDWRSEFPTECFAGDVSVGTHLAVGWGDKGFYVETPTWAELKVSTALAAMLWPSETCLHVNFMQRAEIASGARSVRVTEEQYRELVAFILRSFRRNPDGAKQLIPGAAYGPRDAFFQAQGTYHCLYTCNSWVGTGLQKSGVRTPWLTPLPKTVFLYWPPEENGEQH